MHERHERNGFSEFVEALECDGCGARYGPGDVELFCPACGPSRGTLTVLYDYGRVAWHLDRRSLEASGELSQWRYLPLLPVGGVPSVLHPRVGWTPLYSLDGLAAEVGVGRLWIKDDGLNPSASLKDRASAVAVAHAVLQGRTSIVAASTGNAASSVALFAACAGLRALILVPSGAPRAKLAQLVLFGAVVVAVDGTYDQAFDLSLELARRHGIYCRSTAVNPVLSEGKKTAALELCEQLHFDLPDAVFVSVGDGCIMGGLWKGFQDMQKIGLADRLPRIYGVQAEGSAPLAAAFESGAADALSNSVEDPRTIADSIRVGVPRDHMKALRAARQSGGAILAVEDGRILEAMRLLARRAGVFAEPAGAAAMAGLGEAVRRGLVGRDDRVAVIVTGNGLKDVDGAMAAAAAEPLSLPAEAEAIERALEARGVLG